MAPLTPEEVQRIFSISDPSKSSAGSRLFTATQEHESESLATSFCQTVLNMLFPDNLSVTWAINRDDGNPTLEWRNRYLLMRTFCCWNANDVVLLRQNSRLVLKELAPGPMGDCKYSSPAMKVWWLGIGPTMKLHSK